MMEILAMYETKLAKRIKLEHSYAREDNQFEFAEVREEDPLKIYPEDLDSIKKEVDDVETIIIKTEPESGDGDSNQNSHENVNKENKLFYSDYLEPVNGCEVEIENNTDPFTSINDCNDTVPKHVFLELQRMYERTVTDLQALGEKTTAKEKPPVKQKRAPRSQRNGNNNTKPQTLKNEIKQLNDELYSFKAKEQALRIELALRMQNEAEVKKNNVKLEKQVDDLEIARKDHNTYINELKRQLVVKDSTIRNLKLMLRQQLKAFNEKKKIYDNNLNELKQQLTTKTVAYKDCELQCSLLTQKLVNLNSKFMLQKTEVAKLKLDMDIMDKSIIDSLKTRQILKEHLVKLEKELQEMKNSQESLKLQEAEKKLSAVNHRVEELQKLLIAEKKLSSFVSREKDRLLEEHDRKSKEMDRYLVTMKQSISVLKSSLSQKIERCKLFQEEVEKLREEVMLKGEELRVKEMDIKKMEEEYKKKECDYCGL